MEHIWAVPVLVSILILGSLGLIQEAEAAPGDFIVADFFNGLIRVTPDGSISVIAPGLGLPSAVAIDSGGDFIVADNTGTLFRVTPDGSVSVIASELGNPLGVTIDSDGDFIVASGRGGGLLRVTPDGLVSVIAPGFGDTPYGIEIDSGGDFILVAPPSTLLRVTTDGSVSVIASGLGSIRGLAIDSGGDFIVADSNSGGLLRVTTDGLVSQIAPGFGFPVDVAIDSGGDFIVAAAGGKLFRVTTDGLVSVITSGLGFPFGLAIEPTPDLSCGLGTEEIDKQCLPDFAQICGEDTELQGNECVVKQELRDEITSLEDALAAAEGERDAALADLNNLFTNNSCVPTAGTIQDVFLCITAFIDGLTEAAATISAQTTTIGNLESDLAAAQQTIEDLEVEVEELGQPGAPVANQGEGQGVPAQGKNNKP